MELTELRARIQEAFTGSKDDLDAVIAIVEEDRVIFPFNEYEHEKLQGLSDVFRIVVNHRYTYITFLDLKIGDEVIVPSPSWLSDVNPTWTATVTKLESDYDGYCLRVISKI
jgi:hypothetical protein